MACFGYVRATKGGMAADDQHRLLLGAGVDDVRMFVDDVAGHPWRRKRTAAAGLVGRAAMVEGVQAGDVVVVVALHRLGVSAADIAGVVAQVIERGASIRDLGGQVTFGGDVTAGFARAVAEAEAALKREQTKGGSAALAAKGDGVKRGPAKKLDGEALEAARRDWADTSLTARAVAGRHGVSTATLLRELGRRGGGPGRKRGPGAG
jgi:hypothetical protein